MEEIRITIDGTYMNVIKFGNGPKNLAVVAGVNLLGLEGQGDTIAAAYDMFTDDYTVYMFDRRKKLKVGTTVKDMAEDILYCLDQLEVSRTSLYGVSQGGMIVQYMTLLRPNMVEKLVIASSACRINPMLEKVSAKWIALAEAKDVVAFNHETFIDVYSQQFLDSVGDMLPELEKMGTAEDCDRFVIEMKACEGFDVHDRLNEIDCPVFVLGDEQDKVLGTEGSYEIAEAIGCDIYIYNGYSHAVYDEAPDIKDRIKQFLD